MDIHQLRCFLAVAEELHFGRAAERLHLTTSPISRAIRDLERELAVPLFIRRYHQVELTVAGDVLAQRAARLLADFDRLGAEVRSAGARRPVRLGGTHMAPPTVLDDLVDCAESTLPDNPVSVLLAPSSELLAALEVGALDAALVHLPIDLPSLDSRPIACYRLWLAMRHDDPLAGHHHINLGELADRSVAVINASPQPLAMRALRRDLQAGGLRRIHELDETDVLKVAGHVRRTGEPTFTLSPSAGGPARVYEDPAFALVPLRDGPDFHLGLAWRRDGDPLVDLLLTGVANRWGVGERRL